MEALSKDEIHQKLKKMEGWSHVGKALQKKYNFKSFMPAINFVNKIAEAAGRDPDALDYTRWGSLEVDPAGGRQARATTGTTHSCNDRPSWKYGPDVKPRNPVGNAISGAGPSRASARPHVITAPAWHIRRDGAHALVPPCPDDGERPRR